MFLKNHSQVNAMYKNFLIVLPENKITTALFLFYNGNFLSEVLLSEWLILWKKF